MAQPRQSVLLLSIVFGAVVTVTLLLDSQRVFSDRPVVYSTYQDVVASVKDKVAPRCPAHCPSDPFVQPGMLHWSTTGKDNETRWMPFPHEQHDWETMPDALHLPLNDAIPPEAWQFTPVQFTARLEQRDDAWDWMRNRTIILVDDRNNVEQLCDVIGGTKSSWGAHTGGTCYVERLDLLITNWFLYGMIDVDGGWPEGQEQPATFENRIKEIMIPHLAESGFGKRPPDLSIISSLFWDDAFLDQQRHKAHKEVGTAHGFIWSEIAWHRGRVRELIKYMHGVFGESLPVMFRTRQIRLHHEDYKQLRIFQLDQGCRAVAKEMGVRLFTWGGKLEGYDKYYDNDMHWARGPNTYVFGDMLFFYLHRAVTRGCWSCHQWDD